MNSLSPRQYLHAYITISILKSLFIISLSLPLFTAVQFIGIPRLNLSFLYIIPILAFLIGQTVNLLVLSFIAHSTSPGIKRFPTIWEQIGGSFLLIFLGIMCYMPLLPWGLVPYLWDGVFKLPPPSFENRFDLISLYFLFPIMLLTVSAVAYKLCLYGFKINYKPKYSYWFYNIFIYTIFSTCLAAIYFILALLFR